MNLENRIFQELEIEAADSGILCGDKSRLAGQLTEDYPSDIASLAKPYTDVT